MRIAHTLMILGSMALSIAGCGGEDADEPQAKSERDHVWKGQTQALETARGVANDVESQQSAMDERLRSVTGNSR